MKFIFPRNYNFKSKLFGFIDYQILIINIIFDLFVLCFCNLFIKNINIKIFIFICFCFTLLILSIFGLNNENIFSVLIYLIKYLLRPKIYLFKKF